MRISPSSSVTRMRARRSLSEACSQPSNLVYTTNEVSPESWGLSSSSIPKSVSLSPYSVQLSARTRAVHSTTPSHSLATRHRPVAAGFGQACRGGTGRPIAGDLLQSELVRSAIGVGGAGGDDLGYGAYRVAAPQVHHPDALGGAALPRDRVGVHADGRPEVGDDHELVKSGTDDPHAGQPAALPVGLHRDHTLSAASLRPVLGEGRALAETALGKDRLVSRVVGDHVHTENDVVLAERNTLDSGRGSAHGPGLGLREADALAVAAHDNDLVAFRGVADGDQLVLAGEVDRDDPIVFQGRVVLQEPGLLDDASLGREEQVLGLPELLGRENGSDVLALLEGEHVGDVASLRGAAHSRELVDLEPVDLALVGKEEHVVVRRRDKEVVDVVALFEFHSGDAHPTTALLAEGVDGDALQVTAVGDGDHHLLLGYEVLYLEVDALLGRDRRPAIVRVGRPDLAELLLDYPVDLGLIGRDALEILDLLAQVPVLPLDLLTLHRGEPLQPEVKDRLRLAFGEPEPLHQVLARRLHATGATEGRHDFVEIPKRDQQSFEDVGPSLGPPELVARPARHHLELVGDVVPQSLLVGERLRHTVDERDQVHPEALLHLGVLVEVVEDDFGHGLALQLDHYAHPVPVRLVAQVGDVLQFAVLDQLGDLLQEVALVDLVRDFRDDYLGPVALDLLGVGLCLHPYGAPPGLNGVAYAAQPDYNAPRREIGALDVLCDLLVIQVRVVYQGYRRVDDLAEVVGWDLGGHTHRDAIRPVDEQVGEPRRQDLGLLQALVEVRNEIHRVGIYVPQHLSRHAGEPGFCVPHRARWIAVHAPEVTLAVHERVSEGEVLGHACQRVVDRLVPVRVVLAHDVSNHRRALAVRPVGLQAEILHSVENAAVDGLQAVSRVGQGARDYHAHGVGKERVL